jgi:integrase
LPGGVTLVDAAEFYNRHREHARPDVSLHDAVQRFLADREAAGLCPSTLRGYRHQLGRLVSDMGGDDVAIIRTAALMAWLDAHELRGRTRTTYRASFSALFGWCARLDMCDGNPASRIARHVQDQRLSEVFTAAEAARLMAAAEETAPGMVPIFALGLFAGVRVGELERLDWAAVKDEHIHIGPQVAKKRRQRFVTISANLDAWIRVYRADTGPVVSLGDTARRRARARLVADAGLDHWSANGCRHSFATYHRALHRDAGSTALELGHASTDLLFASYRVLATADEAHAYFSITPAERA